jgi:hypothetical protein
MTYELDDMNVLQLQALKLCCEFCQRNAMKEPQMQQRKTWKRQIVTSTVDVGYYSHYRNAIQVYVERCKWPNALLPETTWPGYFNDDTVLGVIAHELGHHWHWNHPESQFTDEWTGLVKNTYRTLSTDYAKVVKPLEPATTKYGQSCAAEGIADAFKVFVTNPTLLLALAPCHYAWFTRKGLQPVVTAHWSDVLASAPSLVRAVTEKISERRLRSGELGV